MTAAGDRCECAGQCGTPHRKHGGRCPAANTDRDPLHAIARDLADLAAMTCGPAGLIAACDYCHDGMLRGQGRRRKAAELAAPPQPGLFDAAERHHCHATGCGQACPPRLLMCRRHWFMVPAGLRAAVLAAYRPGQEITKTPSPEWLAAARAAIRAVETIEGR
jgi:hypothetical protein